MSAAVDGVTLAEADDPATTGSREDQATYTVTLDSEPTGTVTVNIESEDTDIATVAPAALTFDEDDWSTARTVTVTAVADDADNPGDRRTVDIAHTVSADGTDYAGETADPVTVTVTDDDDAPGGVTLTVDTNGAAAGTPDTVAEGAGATVVTVSATVNGATRYAQAQTVTVSVSDGTAASPADYAAVADFDIVIPANAASHTGTFTLTPADDALDEPNETVNVTGASGSITVTPDVLTITDNDATPGAVTLTVDADTGTANVQDSLAEGGGVKTVRVTATLGGATRFPTDKTVTVKVGKAADSAAEGTDYTAVADQVITIRAGAASGHVDFPLTPTDDAIDEVDETISIEGALTGVTVTPTSLTLTDDDTRGITVAPVALTLAEADNAATLNTTENQATYTVVLDSEPTGTVSISLASGDTDVATVAPASLTFDGDDWSTAKTVTVTAVDDDLDNTGNARSATIAHTVSAADTDYASETADPVTVTVTDDDAAPTLSIDSPSVAEGDNTTVTLTFTVSLAPASGKTVTVGYADRLTGTATSGTDYTALTAGALTFAPGETSKTIAVAVAGDTTEEPDETVVLRLSSAANATLDGGGATLDATGTITDDDTAPTVSIGGVPSRINSTTAFTATFTWSEDVTGFAIGDVTVTGGAKGAFSGSGKSYTLTVTPAGSADVTVTVAANSATDGLNTGPASAVSATATWDAAAVADIYLVAIPTSLPEDSPADVVLTIEARIRGGATFDTDTTVTVSFGQAGDSAISGTDYEAVPDLEIVIPAGKSFWAESICPRFIDDTLVEGDEKFSIVGRAGALTVDGAEVTIIDDETREPTSVTLSVDPDRVGEGAGATQVRIMATVDGGDRFLAGRTVMVSVGATDDTATEGADYEAVADFPVTIAAKAVSGSATFTLTPIEDTDFEGAETIGITGAASDFTVKSSASIEIADNDEPEMALTLAVDTDTGTDGLQTEIAEGDSGTRVQVTARMTGSDRFQTDRTLMVLVGIADDSAAEGIDYAALDDFPITLAAGAESGTGTFTLTPVDDTMAEGDETITVDGRLTGASVGSTWLTLTDNDESPNGIVLSASPASVREDGRQTAITVTATVPGSSTHPGDTDVTVSVGSGTATAGADFSPVGDFTVTVPGGETSGSGHFALSPIDDSDSEGDETVTVTGAAGDIAVTATAVTIEDDEAPLRGIVLSTSDVAVDEGASASWTVKLSVAPDGPVVVTLSGHEGTDLGLDSARLEFDETNWNSARSITVTAGEDDDAADDTATLVHAASGGGYDSATASLRIVTDDNDIAAIVLEPDSLSLVEGRGGSYTVALATEPSDDVGIAISGHAGSYLRLDRSTLEFTTSDWNVPQTIAVTAEDDGTDGGTRRDMKTLTHTGSGGGYDGVESELDIDVLLDPIVISIEDAEGPEGSYLEFLVTLSHPSPGDIKVNWATHPELAKAGHDFIPDEGRLHFAAGEQEKVISVWAEVDDLDDPNEAFTVELWSPVGAVLDDPDTEVPRSHRFDLSAEIPVEVIQATGTIVGPAPDPLELSISVSEPFVDEGGTTKVRVTATVANELERAIRVPLVYANGTAEDGDYEGAPGLWIRTGQTQGSADIAAFHDEDTDDETLTVSIGELRPLEAVAGDDDSVELTILDDDSAGDPDELTVSVEDATAREGEEDLRFVVRLSQPAPGPVTVWAETRAGTASVNGDYLHGSGEVRFAPGERIQTFTVWVLDDDIDEGHETLTVELSNPDPADVTIARGTATGTIENSDPIPGAWLARFGRTLAQQTVDSVSDRFQARREPGFEGSVPMLGIGSGPGGRGGRAQAPDSQEDAGSERVDGSDPAIDPNPSGGSGTTVGYGQMGGASAGSAYSCGAQESGSPPTGSPQVGSSGTGPPRADTGSGFPRDGRTGGCGESPTIGEFFLQALSDASFTHTGETDPDSGTLAWWGRGATSQFTGRDGNLGLGGEIATGRLGVDYAHGDWLAGVTLAHSAGKGDWSGAAGGGELEVSLTSLSPYAAMSFSDRLEMWTAAGVGRGVLKLAHGNGGEWTERLKTDLEWRMAAAGARGGLLRSTEGDGLELSLVADALWSETLSGHTRGLVASQSAVTRLRFGLEGSWAVVLNETRLTPKLELGARHDGGDAESGFGVDLGGGISWADPKLGISLEIDGRTLIAHQDEGVRDWGVSASFAYRANPDSERGLALKLGQDLGGQADGGLAAMFAPEPPGQRFGASGGGRWTSELAYGFPILGKRFMATPRVSYGVSDMAREYSIGWSLAPTKHGPDLSLDVLSTWRESGLAAPENGIRIEFKARW